MLPQLMDKQLRYLSFVMHFSQNDTNFTLTSFSSLTFYVTVIVPFVTLSSPSPTMFMSTFDFMPKLGNMNSSPEFDEACQCV